MKYLRLDELVVGEVYLFRHTFNSKRIILQPARFLGIETKVLHDWSQTKKFRRPRVHWIIQNYASSVPVGDGSKAAAAITKNWLQNQMLERADQMRALQAEEHLLYDLYKVMK